MRLSPRLVSRRVAPACLRVIPCALVFASAAVGHASDTVTEIGRDSYLIRGEFPDGRQPDGNSILLLAPQGVVVIDTGRHLTHTQRIVDFARARGRNVAAVVNTHWHLDHIGGNALLRETFPEVRVYASNALTAARQGFLSDYRRQLELAIGQAKPATNTSTWRAELRLIDAADRLAPDRIVEATASLKIAGRDLTLHLARRAVTAADLWIEDRSTRTVFAGDLVTLPVPFFDTACPTQWSLALTQIAAKRFDTLVPGHGPPLTRQQFDVYRDAFTELLACSASTDPTRAEPQQRSARPVRAGMSCADRWIEHMGTLLEPDDRKRVGPMLDYYRPVLEREACAVDEGSKGQG